MKVLESLEKYLLYAIVFLLPVAFLPSFANAFVPTKLAVLVFGIGLVLLIKSARVISSGKLELSVGSFDFPVLLLAAAYLLSTILRTPNKMDALLLPGGATALIGGALLYFLLNQLDKKSKEVASMSLFFSGIVFSVLLLLASTQVFSKIPQLPAFMRIVAFNPAGGFLPAAIFLAVTIPVGIGLLLREKVSTRKIFLGAGVAIVTFGLIMAVFNLLPGKDFSPRFPTATTSWSVAIDSLKESPIFGIGPGNYLTAFSRFRPISYNTTDLWAIRFGTAHDFYLTAFTETGLLGAAGIILLILAFFRFAKQKVRESNLANWGQSGNTYLFSAGLLIILMALFPATALLTMVIFILLSLTSDERKTSLNLSTPAASFQAGGSSEPETSPTGVATQKIASRLPAILVTLPVIVLVLFVFVRASRVLAAETKFKSALDALIANDTATYDLMRDAINMNPTVDRYHISYSQVNLALANAIAQNPDITDQDRANIAQLIQQAIREGKAAVALNPLRAANWEMLGRIYQSLIPFAQGADAFAIQSFRQAVALDPINPNLRIALGGVHFAQGNYDAAVRAFELAAVAKPDHANAHYNLAFAYRESGDIDNAINQMTIVLSLLDDRTSPDYESARSALEDLESRRVGSTETPAGEELTPPQPAEEPVIVPPLELPEESEPPEAPISPTPTPTEEPEEGEGTPTVTPEPTIEP